MGGSAGLRVQRVVDPPVGPHCGDRDDPVVGLARSAWPLAAHVRGGSAVLAVSGVVDDQYPLIVWGGGRIGAHQVQAPVVDLLVVPGGLRQEELQSLHGRVLRAGHRLGASQAGQRLGAVARRRQSSEVLAQTAPLGERDQQVIEASRVLLQRARGGRTGTSLSHRSSQEMVSPSALRAPRGAVKPRYRRV